AGAMSVVVAGSLGHAQQIIVNPNCAAGPLPKPASGQNVRFVDQNGNACSVVSQGRTIVTLDVKTITTGGTAVTALNAGNKTAGGFIQNPASATVNLCINELGTASGTTSSGDT